MVTYLFCQIAGALHQDGENLSGLNAVVIQPGKVNRSPCVKGLCARMAVLHTKRQMQIGDKLISRSVINARFKTEIVKPTKVEEIDAIMPTVSGQGWITGTRQHTLDPTDL